MMGSLGTKYVENRAQREVEGLQEDIKGWGQSLRDALAGFCRALGFGRGGDDSSSEAGSSSSQSGGLAGSQRGKEALAEILERFELPVGLFPRNHKTYTMKELPEGDGVAALEVRMPFIMEVQYPDGTKIRFNKKVACTMSVKELAGVSGMKVQGMSWAKVQSITVESPSKKIVFRTKVRRAKKVSHFEHPKEGVEVEKY